jgi:hypothetical protein
MKLLKYIGFGAIIWAVAFVLVCIFIGFKVSTDAIYVKIITTAAVIITAVLLARSLKLSSIKQAFICGLSWVLTGIVLDILATVPFTGWQIFSQWNVIVGYAIGFVIPFLAVKK